MNGPPFGREKLLTEGEQEISEGLSAMADFVFGGEVELGHGFCE
jgi:hypothetical protein